MKTRLNKIAFLLGLLFSAMACQVVTGLRTQAPPSVEPAQNIEATATLPTPIGEESVPIEENAATPVYEWVDVSPAPDKFSLIKIVGNGADLGEILLAEAQKATELGREPYVDFSADWCPPCQAIEANIDDELMIDAFTGTYIIQLDFDEWEKKLSDTGFYVIGIPSYYEIDGEGYATGRMITGSAWGEDIPENIAPPMKAFFAGE